MHDIDASREPADPAVVRAALADQLDCYRQLAALAKAQSRHVYSGDTDALLSVLAQRESLMAAATELEESLRAVKANFDRATGRWLDEDRAAVRSMFGEAKTLLAELTKADEKDAAALRARSAMAGGELRRLDAGDRSVRRINQRYAAAAYGKRAKGLDVSS